MLVSLNGQPLTTAVDIRDAEVGHSSTQTFQLEVLRSGTSVVLDYTVQ